MHGAITAPHRYAGRLRSSGGSRRHLVHLLCELCGSQDSFLKENVQESCNPSLVIGELADELAAGLLDTPALHLGVDDVVEVEHVGERVAALLPRLELVLDPLKA